MTFKKDILIGLAALIVGMSGCKGICSYGQEQFQTRAETPISMGKENQACSTRSCAEGSFSLVTKDENNQYQQYSAETGNVSELEALFNCAKDTGEKLELKFSSQPYTCNQKTGFSTYLVSVTACNQTVPFMVYQK